MLKWKIGDTTITQVLEICDGSGSLPLLPDAPQGREKKEGEGRPMPFVVSAK